MGQAVTRMSVLKGAKYLSFDLGGEEYCMGIMRIREILAMPEITPVPRTPEYVKGVMNLRGNILPVLDLRLRFGMEFRPYTDRTCVVVVEIPAADGSQSLGLVVDTIHEVLVIPDEKIARLPYVNARIRSEYLQGFTESNGKLRILLDVEKIFDGSGLDLQVPGEKGAEGDKS